MHACKNVGGVDRGLRFALGGSLIALALLTLGAAEGAALGVIALIAGTIFLATSLVGFCPLYLPLKISTGKPKAS